MQATGILAAKEIDDLVDAMFQFGPPEIVSADSEFGEALEQFTSAGEVKAKIAHCISEGAFFYGFSIRYPSCEGRIERTLVALKPEFCRGHTFRYSSGGWGVIQLQLDFKRKPNIECRIAVNSERRASTWEPQYPQWAPVSAWKWQEVEKHARRLCRKLKSLAQPIIPPDLSRQAAPVR